MHGGSEHDKFCEQTAECVRLRMALKVALAQLPDNKLTITPEDWNRACYGDVETHEHAGGIEVQLTPRYPAV